jgi:four helix bundle protein
MEIAEACYELTRRFPKEELFGLTSQIRRAASSIPANIAEGYGRAGRREYVQFLYVAQGSLKELETHLLLASRVHCCSDTEVKPVLQRAEAVGKMLRSLTGKLRS